MKKLHYSLPNRLIIGTFCFLFFLLVGCKKEALEPIEELKENISKQELKDWISAFETNISNGNKVLLDKAVTTFVNKQMIVRVPLSSGGGEMIFSKNKTLEVIFFRRVSFADKISSRFTGYYESIDMNNYAYKKVNYLDGIKVSAIKGKPIKSSKTNPSGSEDLIESQSTWFGMFFYCLARHIFAVPQLRHDGTWGCSVLGGGESDDDGGDEDDGEDGGEDEFPPYIPIIYPPNNPPSPPPGYGYDPNPFPGNGSTLNYNDFNRTDDDIETGDIDNNQDGYVDDLAYSDYNDQTQPWPTIQNVIPVSLFVGWNRSLHPGWQCFDYAKAQIGLFKYFPDKYDNNRGNTIQIYKEGVANINAAKNGVGYLIEALKAGIPVIVGVDDQPGSPNPQTDNTTDHFIVIVGIGSDANGNYFSFYDNASGDPIQGASMYNKLYYNSSTGLITGKSQTDYAKASSRHDYIITMIRKSLKK